MLQSVQAASLSDISPAARGRVTVWPSAAVGTPSISPAGRPRSRALAGEFKSQKDFEREQPTSRIEDDVENLAELAVNEFVMSRR
jgi:hypothetical protein